MTLDDIGNPFIYVHSCSADVTICAYLSVKPINITGERAREKNASGALFPIHISVSVYCGDPESSL